MRSTGRLLRALLVHAVLLAGAVFVVAPFVWMLATSVKPPEEVFSATLRLLPERFYGTENYAAAMTRAPLLRFALNGVVVCAGILAVQLLCAIPCAYALAKLRFPGRRVLFLLVLLALAIPVQVPALPLYIALAEADLLNTYFSLMLPFFFSAFAIFLLRQFFRSFPDDIIHAARLDGVGELEIVWRIVVPSAWPAIAAFSVFSVVAHWNDYFWLLIAVGDQSLYTPPLGIAFFRLNDQGTDYGALMAAATLVIAPLVVAFLFAQRRFIEGITFTGMKR